MRLWHRVQDNNSGKVEIPSGVVRECADEVIQIKGPTVIWLSGGLTTDDPPLSQETLTGLTRQYFAQMFPYINLADAAIVADLTGKVDEYCAGNINLVDKVLGFSYKTNVGNKTQKGQYNRDHVKVYCASYRSTEKVLQDQESCRKDPNHFFSDEAMDLVRRVLLPVIARGGEVAYEEDKGQYNPRRWKVAGNKRDAEAAAAELRNLTFTGNSYGSSFLLQIENALQHVMKKLGYTESEQKLIMKNVCATMISNISPFKVTTGPRFTAVYIEGVNDRVAKVCNPEYKTEAGEQYYYPPIPKDEVGKPLESNNKIPDSAPPYFYIQQCQDNRALVLSDVNRKVEFWKERSGYFDYGWVDNDHTGHHVSHYTMRGNPYSILPDLVERSLRNAVCRTQNPIHSIQDLFRPCQLWQYGDAALTLDKIKSDTLSGMIRKQFKAILQERPQSLAETSSLATSRIQL